MPCRWIVELFLLIRYMREGGQFALAVGKLPGADVRNASPAEPIIFFSEDSLAPPSTVFSTPHPPRCVVNISESWEHRHSREDFSPSTFELVRENPSYNLVISRSIASDRYGGRCVCMGGVWAYMDGSALRLYSRGVSAPYPDQFTCSYCQGLSSLYLSSNCIVIYVL